MDYYTTILVLHNLLEDLRPAGGGGKAYDELARAVGSSYFSMVDDEGTAPGDAARTIRDRIKKARGTK
jgi:hypothetical protein